MTGRKGEKKGEKRLPKKRKGKRHRLLICDDLGPIGGLSQAWWVRRSEKGGGRKGGKNGEEKGLGARKNEKEGRRSHFLWIRKERRSREPKDTLKRDKKGPDTGSNQPFKKKEELLSFTISLGWKKGEDFHFRINVG